MAPSATLIEAHILEPQKLSISETDQQLIEKLKVELADELKLVPGYESDLSLMRWIVGWNRQIDQIIPRLRTSLQTIHCLRLPEQDFSSVEKVVDYCDGISEAANFLPGTLIGKDRSGNVVSLQVLGCLDGLGLMNAVKISDLYISRISESEGVSNLLRQHEQLTGEQLGTVVIIDLSCLSREGVSIASAKVISIMLEQLQEMFPDVLRKVLIINAPRWISAIWLLISPVLSKQTQMKIEFLGSDWKEKLQVYIDPTVLFEHWGGTRKSSTPYGNVRMGGKVPEKLYYSADNETIDLSDLQKLNVPARNKTFIEVEVKDEDNKLGWYWQNMSGDLDFWVTKIDDENEETLVWPKFRLLTSFVPEKQEIQTRGPGTYRLNFGNTHGKIFSKDVMYKFWLK